MERERTGAYTVQTQLALTLHDRRKLERMVRARHVDPADLISALIAGAAPQLGSDDDQRRLLVPMRLYLSADQRSEVAQFAEQHHQPLEIVLSEMVAQALRELPDLPAEPERGAPLVDLRGLAAELERLRVRRAAAGRVAPRWLDDYIAQLEAEMRRSAT
jgi:hypothetical protein